MKNAQKKIGLKTLISIANSLGVTADELLNGNQMYNPSEYQTDMDLLMADCNSFEKRIIYELALAIKTIIRNNHGYFKTILIDKL